VSDAERIARNLPPAENVPKAFPAFEDFTIDEEGRLFIRLYDKPENGEGRYLAKAVLKTVPRLWKKGKLYVIDAADGAGSGSGALRQSPTATPILRVSPMWE
jgi:hypothetical protein